MKGEILNCQHYWEVEYTEIPQQPTSSDINEIEEAIVICRNCGAVKRQIVENPQITL